MQIMQFSPKFLPYNQLAVHYIFAYQQDMYIDSFGLLSTINQVRIARDRRNLYI